MATSANFALAIGTVALFAGCSGSQPTIGAPGALPQAPALATSASSTNYRVVYSFGAAPDAENPRASLIDVGGTLYGTTSGGGSNSCGNFYRTCGTVFSVTPDGTEKVLYSFGPATTFSFNNGFYPVASLTEAKGKLYGTTENGGYYCSDLRSDYLSCGTVFSVTLGGTEKVRYKFDQTSGDGADPQAPLIKVRRLLYGTTFAGGYGGCLDALTYTIGCGTVFSITPSGAETVLHRFGSRPDGKHPVAGLIDVRGTLYGTTSSGGKHDRGTVFSITPNGDEKVLHSFGKPPDGSRPHASLIEVKGKLYGTTVNGGAYNANGGTVFSITLGGKEKVLHSFGNGTDGSLPVAPLIDVQGTLYGTTAKGGAYGYNGNGTVFSITLGGTEKVLHSFGSPPDGNSPAAALIDVNGTLYGTTQFGGGADACSGDGCGTVFALTP